MFKLKTFWKIVSVFALFLFISQSTIFASENQIFLENLPGLDIVVNETNFDSTSGEQLSNYINWIIKTSVILGSILAVAYIIFGGITYMTTDSFSNKTEGRENVRNAIGGLIFLIGGYLIFIQINPDILNVNFSTAAGRVEIQAGEMDLGLDRDDPDNYNDIKDENVRNGYDNDRCVNLLGLLSSFTESGILEECNELRSSDEFKDKETTSCAKRNWTGGALPDFLDITTTYCFSYKSGSVEEQNQCIKSLGENTTCSPCRSNTGACGILENTLKGHIVSKKYNPGARVQFCAYDGEAQYKRDYQCLKGTKIDETKYIMQGSMPCEHNKCENSFNILKELNNWPSSCTYKLVYKKYDKDLSNSEFWIYTNKETCK